MHIKRSASPIKAMEDASDRQRVRRTARNLMKKAGLESSSCSTIDLDLSEDSEEPEDVVVAPLRINELHLGKILGQGAFSQVFAIESIQLEETNEHSSVEISLVETKARKQLSKREQGNHKGKLVVKHLKRALLKKGPKDFQRAVQDLEREADFLSRLNHPNIVTLRGNAMGGTAALMSGQHNEFFLVLDQLTDTLEKRIARWNLTSSRPSLEVIVDYAQALASALAYLHKQRIIFRDVKPDNVGFLTEGKEDRLQLFDLGFCRTLPAFPGSSQDLSQENEDVTYRMSLAGTYRYMAPEMLLRQGYNCKADVHSWALTVSEMISLQKPYDSAETKEQLIDSVCFLDVRPDMTNFELPESLMKVLQGAWAPLLQNKSTMKKVLSQLSVVKRELRRKDGFMADVSVSRAA